MTWIFSLIFLMTATIYPIALAWLVVDFWDTLYTTDLIGEVLQKGHVCDACNRRACITRCMNVMIGDFFKSKPVVVCSFCLPPWKKGVSLCLYVFEDSDKIIFTNQNGCLGTTQH